MNMMNRKSIIVNDIPITLNDRSDAEREQDEENGVKTKYEARIYNKTVRECLEEGESNSTMWSDAWADPHYETAFALDPEEAIEIIYEKFPKRGGFVITDIVEMEDERRTGK